MENLQIILSIAATALGLLVTTLTFVLKFINNEKTKKTLEQFVKISGAIIPYIEQAEKIAGLNGEQKKEYVMSQISEYAEKNGIDFNVSQISGKIEELIKLTKKVNAIPGTIDSEFP